MSIIEDNSKWALVSIPEPVLSEQDKLNAEYDFYKKLQYALSYNTDCNAKVIACVPTVHKDFMFNITRSELLDLVTTRRQFLHEQLNSI